MDTDSTQTKKTKKSFLMDTNPFDELFKVLDSSTSTPSSTLRKFSSRRELPESFHRQKTFNPKRDERIRQAQRGHFKSLRNRHDSHVRSKSEPIKVVTGPQNAGIKSRIPEARASLKKIVSDSSNQSFARRLSFKTQDIPLERIPLPKHWLKKVLVIDDVVEIYFHNTQSNLNTRNDPRMPIKEHLEELHVTLTAQMISLINNSCALGGDSANEQADLPHGCRWQITEKGEVFFANDLARKTSWLHPRVESQLLHQKLPPLVQTSPAFSTDKIAETTNRQVSKSLPVVSSVQTTVNSNETRQIPAHLKQFSMDSGVGSTCSVHPTGIFVKNIPLVNENQSLQSTSRATEVVTPTSKDIMETDFGASLLKSPGMHSLQSQEYVVLEEVPTTSTLTVKPIEASESTMTKDVKNISLTNELDFLDEFDNCLKSGTDVLSNNDSFINSLLNDKFLFMQ